MSGQTIDLDTTYPGILIGSWLVLSATELYQEVYRATSVIEAAQANYTLAGKTTRVALDTNESLDQFRNHYREHDGLCPKRTARDCRSSNHDAQLPVQPIRLAQAPSSLTKGPTASRIRQGQHYRRSDHGNRSRFMSVPAVLRLTVTPPLIKSYARVALKPEESFSLNANVAHATHGETVSRKSQAAATLSDDTNNLHLKQIAVNLCQCGERRAAPHRR